MRRVPRPGGATRQRGEELRSATLDEIRVSGLSGDVAPEPRVLERRRTAGRDFDRAVEAVRLFPGFEGFLQPPQIETLARAALPGRPVIYAHVAGEGGLLVAMHRQNGYPEILWTELSLTEHAVDSMLFGVRELDFAVVKRRPRRWQGPGRRPRRGAAVRG